MIRARFLIAAAGLLVSDAQSAGLRYHWIYQKLLDDQDKLSALVRLHKLALPGVP
jgi:hypothetical protein